MREAQGSLSPLRGSLGAGRQRRWHCPRLLPGSWALTLRSGVDGADGAGGREPGEQLRSSIQMRIVPPTLPGLQGPPLEPPEEPPAPAQTFPGPLWVLTPRCNLAGGHLAPSVRIKSSGPRGGRPKPRGARGPGHGPVPASADPRPLELTPGLGLGRAPGLHVPASSSSDSSGSCPCDGARGPAQPAPPARGARTPQAAPTAPGRARPAPAGGQRQSASEREKLRMRTLARALHELRRFLPPSVAPAGQSLTKIETLRLAIRYIGHLSAVLGLSEDSLRRRRPRPRSSDDETPPRGCPLCPDGGPAQAQTPTPARGQILGSAAPAAGSWGSPPACLGVPAAPECLGSRIPDVGPWVSPLYCSGTPSLPQVSQRRAPDAALWTPPEAGSGTQTPGEPGTPAVPWAPPPAAPEPAAVYQGICVSPESYLLPETPPLLPAQHARDCSLRPNGDTGATVQRCCPARSTRDQAPPSISAMTALSRAQACSSVAALNFGKKTWRGAT
ncbi:hypothetical protein QTO34_012749 [Cnephaeus nilssonii]|uniref:BHLH domain-containing protein n=1 Tax=Cnephaeus nilssonii TaxID=3371016 RepID=A0AA40LC77_CNENI|nr:hypothetical protein QTO34_012749 [Eptesicus nilssonii]